MLEKKDCCESVSKFIQDIKQKKISGSYNIAISTVELLKKLITQTEWKTAEELLKIIQDESKHLHQNLPLYPTVESMVGRILKIIREEYINGREDRPDAGVIESLQRLMLAESPAEDYKSIVPELQEAILEHITELETELENSMFDFSADNIVQQACEHIHSNEIILTIGKSSLVEAFLKAAAAERKFEVIVAECAPFCLGHEMAVRLARSKIETTVIADSSVFALMSRVNKVIIGTHTIMANGGLRAVCGSHSVALAAKHFSVPVYVLAPMYKLINTYLCSYDQDTFNCFVSPEGVLHYSDGAILSKVHVYNPVFDYVPPELVTLFISNNGGHAPSYVYRLNSELYRLDDK
ncbi:Methylthioribose-1-phosphate isomerase [Gryllus bimaculatus]|nr:Methylthioribose-1-phosphate isomerase [Gryllus bimaculatus]